jgi:endonuclease-3
MNNPNRTTLIAKLQKTLKKHYKTVTAPDRTLLEHMLYACCLENAPFDKADEAFATLQQTYFDWNEVRVTSATELAEVFATLPQSQAAALRIKRVLQGMFDVIYGFDLEPLKKQNLGKALKDIERFGATPFVSAYVAQNGLGGHAIATDEAAFDVLVICGIVSEAEASKGLLPGIERAVPKNKGVEFFSQLHQLAADLYVAPNSPKMRAILGEITGEAKERIADRMSRKQVMAHEEAKAAAKERKAAREAAAAALETPQKPPKPAGDTAKDEKEKGKAKAVDAKKGKAPAKPQAPEKPAKSGPAGGKPAGKPEAAEAPKKRPEAGRGAESRKKEEEPAKKPVSKGLAKKKPR